MLVAIAIPIFTSQLEKSRQATDLANIRAAYAEASVQALDGEDGAVTTAPMVHLDAGFTKNLAARIGDIKIDSNNYLKSQCTKGDEVTVRVNKSTGGVSIDKKTSSDPDAD